MEYALNTRDFL
uniref:Uncharacterized protein n=1 Tax=Arundo donax TaxID=35708 RepID=A0A0A8ZP73_ARUDO